MEKRQPAAGPLLLRLYVADDAPNSVEAKANLKAICRRWLEPDGYELEIINVLEEPLRALEDGVLVTPTLKRASPVPVSIVGTLNDHGRVSQALGLEERSKQAEVRGAASSDVLPEQDR
jgi:circadian clock protein KaiB